PLRGWAYKHGTFPTVAKLARRYMAVQTSSAAPERLFSVHRRNTITTKKRKRLSGKLAADIFFCPAL
ncbi:unnamed protein product, partial [Laminaria digitata]